MKIEEAKALFMAQYLGQEVFVPAPADIPGILIGNTLSSHISMSVGYLLLRSVQDLTDEEAIQAAKLQSSILECEGYDIKVTRNLKEPIYVWAFYGKNHIKVTINEWSLNIIATDYLRRIGILLDFTYLSNNNKPVTLSPATLISMGWVRVK